MDDSLELLLDLHLDGDRQGPGSDAQTRQAIALAGLPRDRRLAIADIGCGTGASTLVLAQELDAQVTAVDFLPPFLKRLRERAQAQGLDGTITTVDASMDALPFDDGSLDVIWAEGAIYNIGFEHGVQAWRRFLKPGGVLAVSELTWLTAQRPEPLQAHWNAEYPEVATASAKLAVLERHGYTPIGYFVLPAECWLEGYYGPMQRRFDRFLAAHGNSEAALAVVAAEAHEIALYTENQAFVSYGFYVARRVDGG
jgi:SAM-dependent methyltransferase